MDARELLVLSNENLINSVDNEPVLWNPSPSAPYGKIHTEIMQPALEMECARMTFSQSLLATCGTYKLDYATAV